MRQARLCSAMDSNEKSLPKPSALRHQSSSAPYEVGLGHDAMPDEAPPQYAEEPAAAEQILDDAAGATGIIQIEPFLFVRLT